MEVLKNNGVLEHFPHILFKSLNTCNAIKNINGHHKYNWNTHLSAGSGNITEELHYIFIFYEPTLKWNNDFFTSKINILKV